MLHQLLDHLPSAKTVVHIDRSADGASFKLPKSVTSVSDRYEVNWGGYSMVRATLSLYKTAIEMSAPREKIVLLSGQCFPIRAIHEFEDFLAHHIDEEFANHAPVFDTDPNHERRIRERWLFDAFPATPGFLNRPRAFLRFAARKTLPRRTPMSFGSMTPVFGSQWTGLSREFVEFAVSPTADQMLELRQFRTALAPDEIYFQTILRNSSFSDRVAHGSAISAATNTAAVSNFHFIDASLSGYRTMDDYESLIQSPMFFTRKLHSERSKELIAALNRHIHR
jgi:hypothetical protein